MGGCGSKNFFTLDQWVAQNAEEAVDPERVIVDAHHHLFNCATEPRGQLSLAAKLTSCMSRPMKERFLKVAFGKGAIDTFGTRNQMTDSYSMEQMQAEFGGHNVQKTVAIEFLLEDPKAKAKEFEAVLASKIMLEHTRRTGNPDAFVAFVDLRLGKERVAAGIKAHLETNPMVRGLRHQLAWAATKTVFSAPVSSKGIMQDPKFRGGLEACAEAGLSFDVWAWHTQLEELAGLAKDLPDLKICLDHIGLPLGIGIYKGKREQVFKDWERGIMAVAANPNVHCKLSGGTMACCGFGWEKQPLPPTSDELCEALLPYYRRVVEVFGVDRCMFASNFPVDKVSCSYVNLYNAFKKMANKMDLTEEDKDKLFRANATAFYRLEES